MKFIISIFISLTFSFFIGAQEHKDHKNLDDKGRTLKAKTKPETIKSFAEGQFSRTVRYDLYVNDTTVNYTGKKSNAMAINGKIPAPALYFTEGDTALIYVHNQSKKPTSVHWHGILLPNQYDGVSYLTTSPIMPNTTHIFTFPIIQNGTYWYHSHDLEEQIGLYGAFIINKKINGKVLHRIEDDLPQEVVVLSEWTNTSPGEINRNLHTASDWFSIKKHSTQSYGEALIKGHLWTKLVSDWKRIMPMDVADIYYDQFFVNGEVTQQRPQYKKGDKVKIRLINAGASSYFWIQYAGGKMTIIANDGKDVEPVEVDRFLVGNGETYDFIVTIPENMSYELKFTAEDRTNFASLFLGKDMKMVVPKMLKLRYFEGMKMMNSMMDMSGNMKEMGMKMSVQKMDMNRVMYPELKTFGTKKDTSKKESQKVKMDHMEHHGMKDDTALTTLNYGQLRSTVKTTLPNGPLKEFRYELTGNMARYLWTIDNKSISESDAILIKKGENVRIILSNGSMMRHPMHLHGHFFRLLNGQGDFAPLKHTVDIMPMEIDTIEFEANESGDWIFHCHILYHMVAGMGRIFRYENSEINPEVPDPKAAMHIMHKAHNPFYTMAKIGLETNGSDGFINRSNARWVFQTMWHLGFNDQNGYESETTLGRYLGKMQWLQPYVGFDYHFKKINPSEDENIFGNEAINMFGQKSNKINRKALVLGVMYTLPMFIIADLRVDSDGKFRIQASREDVALTNRLRLNFMLNTDKEYMLGGRFILTKYISLSSHYDSDMGPGVGLTLIY